MLLNFKHSCYIVTKWLIPMIATYKDSLLSRYEVLVAPAIIGAHANAPATIGFRQRDVRWLIEFFANWIEPSFESEGLAIKNTQISRYLENLNKEGHARKYIRKGNPRYILTPLGLVELMHRVTEKNYYPQKEHFFFLFSFMVNYRPRVKEVVQAEKKRFPHALQLELEELFNAEALLDKQLYYTKRELKKLSKRMEDQSGAAVLTKEIMQENLDYANMAKRVEKQFPYTLYTKKPLQEMLSETTQRHGSWELTVGGPRRNRLMWSQIKEMLELHIKQLENLKSLKTNNWEDLDT